MALSKSWRIKKNEAAQEDERTFIMYEPMSTSLCASKPQS